MRRLAHALVLFVALALVGAAPAADGFVRHAVTGHGVSLAVPASWVAVDRSLSSTVVERLAHENPALAPYLRQLAGRSSPMKFIALDPLVRRGFATNVNVVVTPLPSGLPFAAYRRALVSELRALRPQRLREGAVRVAGVRALRLEYRFPLSSGGRRHTVQTLQYAFLRPGKSVVVTYTTLPSLAGRYAATFARSAASIRFR